MEAQAPTYVTIPNIVDLIYSGSVLVALIAGGFTLVGTVAVWRSDKNGALVFFRMFETMQMLQLLTVMLVIASATILALLGILNSNGIIGILSGVAGYVLGGLGRTYAATQQSSEKRKGSDPKSNASGVSESSE